MTLEAKEQSTGNNEEFRMLDEDLSTFWFDKNGPAQIPGLKNPENGEELNAEQLKEILGLTARGFAVLFSYIDPGAIPFRKVENIVATLEEEEWRFVDEVATLILNTRIVGSIDPPLANILLRNRIKNGCSHGFND